jgi:hypothetical protein
LNLQFRLPPTGAILAGTDTMMIHAERVRPMTEPAIGGMMLYRAAGRRT